ncbi:MAG: polyprenyl synthetase family protein [Myxococcales bacterium]|nr:polyprenyl synthetase family protein [Myxococcales bacterium]
MSAHDLSQYLAECRELVLGEIRRIIPRARARGPVLYDLMLDYPLREAKGLRPALCIASCRALGGSLAAALPSAAVLELYHNAFLVHDDIEDASLLRRGAPTLHRAHGVPVAINVGDAMLALALRPLLGNVEVIGLGPALRVLEAVARMTEHTVEGQAVELDWVRRDVWSLEDDDYIDMVIQKTGWYSFISPVEIGAITAGASAEATRALCEFARALAVAFQIQDDVLNLSGDVTAYGKEIGGDLWEGKRTLALLHLMRHAAPDERRQAAEILAKPRPLETEDHADALAPVRATIDALARAGELSDAARTRLLAAMAEADAARSSGAPKQEADVRALMAMIERHGSLEHAREVARRWATRAREALTRCEPWLPPSVHRGVLETLTGYVLSRAR